MSLGLEEVTLKQAPTTSLGAEAGGAPTAGAQYGAPSACAQYGAPSAGGGALPPGWFAADAGGATYYYTASGQRQWEPPTSPAPAVGPPPRDELTAEACEEECAAAAVAALMRADAERRAERARLRSPKRPTPPVSPVSEASQPKDVTFPKCHAPITAPSQPKDVTFPKCHAPITAPLARLDQTSPTSPTQAAPSTLTTMRIRLPDLKALMPLHPPTAPLVSVRFHPDDADRPAVRSPRTARPFEESRGAQDGATTSRGLLDGEQRALVAEQSAVRLQSRVRGVQARKLSSLVVGKRALAAIDADGDDIDSDFSKALAAIDADGDDSDSDLSSSTSNSGSEQRRAHD